MLSFKLFQSNGVFELPLSLYSCGLHPMHTIYRPVGYPTFQCMICFSGSGIFHFEQKPYLKMKRGDVLFIPNNVPHDYHPSDEEVWVLGYMGIEGSYIEPLVNMLQLPILQPIAISEHELVHVEKEIKALWQINDGENDKEHYHEASTKIYGLLTYIASHFHKTNPAQQQRRQAGAKELLDASVQYMEQHYMENVSLSNIAYTVGYSKQHFQRKFKEIYGINPSQYLQNLRLLKGAELLAEDYELTVSEIAVMVGMEPNYFVRLFKREYGITPAKYRLSIAKEKQ